MPKPMLGANYTPRQGWFHSWGSFEPSPVQEDLAQIAQLGLDHVRIFPLWPVLQPSRTLISPTAVDDVLRVVDLAGEEGLDISVDLLQGHLSSFDFLPAWISTWHRRNLFTDPDVVAAQHELARVLGTELARRPHVTGMTLGNEIGQFAVSYHPDRHPTTSEQATEWTRALLETVDHHLPDRRHHHSFDDTLWFKDDHPFTPADAVTLGASTTVHSWVFTGAGQTFGEGHPALALYGRYLVEVADLWRRELGAPEDRRIWLQEIGAPTPWVDAEHAPQFADTSIRAAVAHPAVEAVTWWCSHDVSRGLGDFPEVEYSLGLFDEHGRTKPIGEAIGSLIAELRAEHVDVGGPPEQPLAPLPVPALARDGSDRSVLGPRGEVFATWAAEALEGRPRPLATADVGALAAGSTDHSSSPSAPINERRAARC
ncbi:glycosyl hydrolase [Brachybacterium sp. P6-10-X1]|uniref:glycoside hydrolase 5 family protein n=1 Tax=Brachybacterium sp. P6-10-X1 TaxID=1903186 RepID=UPI001C12ABD2|nr:glycosyl hydrolase [Brachybacterium sp. P6-10-X1]